MTQTIERPLHAATANRTAIAAERYQRTRVEHWDAIARALDRWRDWRAAYHRRLAEVYQFLVPPGQRVLELGCGEGDLLAALDPATGVGVDFSPEMVRRARQRHPHLRFVHADVHDLPLDEPFDVVILADLVNELWDVQAVFEQLAKLTTPSSRIVVNSYSRLWEVPLWAGERLGLKKPKLDQNWLTVEDTAGLLNLAGFEVVRHWQEVLWPVATPPLDWLANRWLVKLAPFKHLALTNLIVARPQPERRPRRPVVSVIVPARNEAGNVPAILARMPEMGAGTEIVFVEGHSKDDTFEAIAREIAAHPERRVKLYRQTGAGKGDAVRLGFAEATGDVLMILDADLTVPPEDLPRFYDALVSGKGDFVNGVRLVYPMEEKAMRFLNLLGNKFFSVAFSWLLGQPIKDTLCGTKALWRADYERIAANRGYFGDFDPFGDFDLIFGAARLNLKIVDLPIRYQERTYGATNIHRWRHGLLLLQMLANASRRLKFV
ncbi:MAG: glycosyltransferase [Pirellulales bacterium]|nr:glycosyltransferase [Pirellulales bacterium]